MGFADRGGGEVGGLSGLCARRVNRGRILGEIGDVES